MIKKNIRMACEIIQKLPILNRTGTLEKMYSTSILQGNCLKVARSMLAKQQQQ
jgi:hypothetical protein